MGHPGSDGFEPVYVNGYKWHPAWHHNESQLLPFEAALVIPLDAAYELDRWRVRGAVTLAPPTDDQPFVSVRVDDPDGGADWYVFEISW